MQQHLKALEGANELRLARAEGRQEIAAAPAAAGLEALAGLLERPPWWLKSATIGAVLLWPQYMGRTTMVHLLREMWPDVRVSEQRAIRDLTEREAAVIAAHLRQRAERWGTHGRG